MSILPIILEFTTLRAVTAGVAGPMISSSEAGNVAEETVVIVWNKDVTSTLGFDAGWSFTVDNGGGPVAATISSAPLQPDNVTVHYVLTGVDINGGYTITGTYDSGPGDIEDLFGNPMASYGPASITNNALYGEGKYHFDRYENSHHIVTIGI